MPVFDTAMPTQADMNGMGANTAANMIAQTRNVDAQTQNLQAQRQGIIADSAVKARDLAFQQWMGIHSSEAWDDTGTSPDHGVKEADNQQGPTGGAEGFAPGSGPQPAAQSGQTGSPGTSTLSGPNGQTAINYSKVYRMLSDAGYGDKTSSVIDSMNTSIKGGITNAQSQYDLDKAKMMGVVTAGGIAAQAAKLAPQGQKADAYNFQMQNAVKNGTVPDSQYTPLQESDFAIDGTGKGNAFIKSAFAATITPKDSMDIAINQQNADSASRNAQTTALRTNMDAQGNVVTAQTYINKADMAHNGAESARNTPAPNLPTGAGNWGAVQWARYAAENPLYANEVRMLAQHNVDFPGQPASLMDGQGAVADTLESDSKQYNALGAAHTNVAKAGGAQGLPQVGPSRPGVSTPVPGSQVKGATVQVSKGGRTMMVTPADAAELKSKHGWK
jgi:hypothetical protein